MNFSPPRTPPNELAVVGESKDDPEQLLVRDAEGNFYTYSLLADDAQPVEVDEHWTIEDVSSQDFFT